MTDTEWRVEVARLGERTAALERRLDTAEAHLTESIEIGDRRLRAELSLASGVAERLSENIEANRRSLIAIDKRLTDLDRLATSVEHLAMEVHGLASFRDRAVWTIATLAMVGGGASVEIARRLLGA